MKKRFVCLANSRKHLERCIAGREIANGVIQGNWLRPISNRPSHGVSLDERRYEDRSEPVLGDIICVTQRQAAPFEFQSENFVFHDEHWWEKEGELNWTQISRLVENPARLWVNESNTYEGLNDEMTHDTARRLPNSLCMIHIHDMQFRVFIPGQAFGGDQVRVQAKFSYGNTRYWLWMTDAILEHEYLQRGIGTYEIGECIATISVSEPKRKNRDGRDYVYKLVAGVFLPD
jgi:hypothetical protein